jgi:hypothetical protein
MVPDIGTSTDLARWLRTLAFAIQTTHREQHCISFVNSYCVHRNRKYNILSPVGELKSLPVMNISIFNQGRFALSAPLRDCSERLIAYCANIDRPAYFILHAAR